MRYWSWTPRFFTAGRSMVWLLLALVVLALARGRLPTAPAASQAQAPALPAAASAPVVAPPPVLTAAPSTPELPDASAVVAAVEAWAAAWSEQRFDDYIAAYSSAYQPLGSSRAAWIESRRERLLRPRRIRLGLSEMAVEVTGPATATARFRQSYEADTFSDVVIKRLVLTLEGGWKIAHEESAPL